jgi:hypothetical protein
MTPYKVCINNNNEHFGNFDSEPGGGFMYTLCSGPKPSFQEFTHEINIIFLEL